MFSTFSEEISVKSINFNTKLCQNCKFRHFLHYPSKGSSESGVTRSYKVGRRSASPPTEATTEVSRSKVEAEGSQKHLSPKVLKLKKDDLV